MKTEIDILDLITVLSLYLQLENLQENEKQTEKLNEHLHEQDGTYLKKIIEQNEKIIKLLGGK